VAKTAQKSQSVPKVRRDKALNKAKIAKAAGEILARGERPTAVAIAEETGLSDKTVKRHGLDELLEPFQARTQKIFDKVASKLEKDPEAPLLKLYLQTVHKWSERTIVQIDDVDDPTKDVAFE
jgi:hypothetical protein